VFTSRRWVVPDQASFDDFYIASREVVLSHVTAMTLDRELAADAVQEAYTRAWQRWARVSQLDNPAAWVRTVAWRVAVSQFRRRAVARKVLVRSGPEQPVTEAASEVGIDVIAALRALSREHRRVLVLHEMVGMRVRDIAAETGLPEGTVKSRLSRAREQLAAALGPAYLGEEAVPAGDGVAPLEERR
jgi:RNA polymerase sigma-70 factor (ECF subfamily)